MALPDFLLDPNVVLKDQSTWRYKTAPDYTATNANFETGKSTSWAPSSLEFLVQNLVKNWEKEASYKTDPKEWRTISQEKYAFHLNGGPALDANDMLRLGTYNALIGESGVKDVYETKEMDFGASHKLFKGVMRTFNWEVLELIGAPPKVSIKWRHWGTMTGNYRAKLSSGRTVIAKANHKLIEVFGVTMAEVNEKFEITKLETFWEPESMFRQLITDDMKILAEGETVESVVPVDETGQAQGGGCPVAH
ncbi:Pathogen-related protein [Psilocybe cubensis]|uniref:Pathogen-related protein n=2 Tax=Psilocybe cubensis TaxID=181762 RepID=A0A8H7Y2B7_PSICU|nr:Pathogen-related protein [Psilocybe cubensis]KAH9484832.1 Pathogen-related protein [Psilocybe cubensis]